ncbi:MAG: hypothetical protein K2O89_05215 [Clostridia bacterium]|nr:hypothetical protein [Clostridia bacterium]
MEKFALLDFLKAFESLTAKQSGNIDGDLKTENTPPAPAPAPQQPPAPADFYGTNVMAQVIARHEEIANRIRNKRSV